MTLYYTIVFMLLVFQMGLFCSLIVPMPYTWKRKLFKFVSENPVVAKVQYWMKIIFVFILILFIDSVNRVYRVQIELSAIGRSRDGQPITVGPERTEVQARKFYSQRNMYLCGFTLFLSLILNRTYTMILDVIRLEEEVRQYKGDPKAGGKDAKALENAGEAGEIAKLKREIKKKDQDIETLKKQAGGLSDEYNRLGDQLNTADGSTKKER